jgi:hypothetical protein
MASGFLVSAQERDHGIVEYVRLVDVRSMSGGRYDDLLGVRDKRGWRRTRD